MAQVAHDVTANVDRMLRYLRGRWEDIPFAANEWERWDRFERVDYLSDWPVVESYMDLLRQHAAHGDLTPAQQQRYGRLLALVARVNPMLEQMMQD
jgi:hypothetical protein